MKEIVLSFVLVAVISVSNSKPLGFESELFEGDIIVNPVKRRLAVSSDENLWSNGILYYYQTDDFKSDKKGVENVRAAMDHIESKTCLKFKEVFSETSVKNYLKLINGNGCYSYVGMIGGNQDVSMPFSKGCRYNHAVHELLHAVGLQHLHSRKDRNRYINIDLNNVRPSDRGNFNVVAGRQVTDGFDYYSLMLYTSRAFSYNGKVVIRRTDNWEPVPDDPEKPGMSQGDAEEVNKLYQCSGPGSKSKVNSNLPAEKPNNEELPQEYIHVNGYNLNGPEYLKVLNLLQIIQEKTPQVGGTVYYQLPEVFGKAECFSGDCDSCVKNIATNILTATQYARGARWRKPNCSLRYEFYQFQ